MSRVLKDSMPTSRSTRGLVCINGPERMTTEIEVELFGIVLDAVGLNEMVNEVIEITLAEAGSEYDLVRYALPK